MPRETVNPLLLKEIDALKAEVKHYESVSQKYVDRCNFLDAENARLRETLRWMYDQHDLPMGYDWKLRELGIIE